MKKPPPSALAPELLAPLLLPPPLELLHAVPAARVAAPARHAIDVTPIHPLTMNSLGCGGSVVEIVSSDAATGSSGGPGGR